MKTSEFSTLRPEKLFDLPTTSASGLVRLGASLYVISDDTLSLSQISYKGIGRSIPLLNGDLPGDETERKATKPDFESLFLLGDQLVGLGSGTTLQRSLGFVFPKAQLESAKNNSSKNDLPQSFSLEPLYAAVREKIPGLNIEGAVSLNDEVLVFQRGNTTGSFSGMVRLNAALFSEGLATEVGPSALITIHDLSPALPAGYGFTDVALDPRKPNTVWFLAVREETDNAYDDGAFTGAIIGELTVPVLGEPKVRQMSVLEITSKPEGLWLEPSDDGKLTAFLVTDADCLTIPSALYGLEILP